MPTGADAETGADAGVGANPPQAAADSTPRRSPSFDRARVSLQRAIGRYGTHQQAGRAALSSALQPDLARLSTALDKLDRFVVRIAAFGLVSRGKSAILNALIGESVLETGPLNGVTRVPRSVQWQPTGRSPEARQLEIELIDTPGLDEIGGETRAALAKEIAQQADLILFVVAGDITSTERQALRELRQVYKPLILVFNKIDLYPEVERPVIADRLRTLMSVEHPDLADAAADWQPVLPVDEVVLVAAEPSPIQVREEWPDGRVSYQWESPPPQVAALQTAILRILDREGQALLALNALLQARVTERAIAQKSIHLLRDESEETGWHWIRYKAIAVALLPHAWLDVLSGLAIDALSVRAQAQLYGLPLTRYEPKELWKTLAFSSGMLAASEMGVWFFGDLGTGLGGDNFGNYLGAALIQAAAAAVGSRWVAQATRRYLEAGCTWGMDGADAIARDLLDDLEPDTILHRLRPDLETQLDQPIAPVNFTDPSAPPPDSPATPTDPPADSAANSPTDSAKDNW